MKTGIELIADERKRQIEKEGWIPEHDDVHTDQQLVWASNSYAYLASGGEGPKRFTKAENPPPGWPFEESWWKPSEDPIRNLVKAGALIAAEIDRLQRKGADAK